MWSSRVPSRCVRADCEADQCPHFASSSPHILNCLRSVYLSPLLVIAVKFEHSHSGVFSTLAELRVCPVGSVIRQHRSSSTAITVSDTRSASRNARWKLDTDLGPVRSFLSSIHRRQYGQQKPQLLLLPIPRNGPAPRPQTP